MNTPTVMNQQTGEVVSLARTCYECNENPVDYSDFGLCHEILCKPCAIKHSRERQFAEQLAKEEKARKKYLRSVKCHCGKSKGSGFHACFNCITATLSS